MQISTLAKRKKPVIPRVLLSFDPQMTAKPAVELSNHDHAVEPEIRFNIYTVYYILLFTTYTFDPSSNNMIT